MKLKVSLLIATCTVILSACGGGGSEPSSSPDLGAAFFYGTEVANAAPNDPMSDTEAFRLVDQATFGPTFDDITNLTNTTALDWINQQLQAPVTYLLPGFESSANTAHWNEYINVWFRHAIEADDQLRQRVAFALSEIFVSSSAEGLGDEQPGLAHYYDILLKHSFGNYRELLEDVTLSPIMGDYLNMKGNRKPDPAANIQADENYAREVLQLFSIGLNQLNNDGTPKKDSNGDNIPTFSQSTVEGFARVFTGWHYADADNFVWSTHTDFINPMEAWPEHHDNDEKILLDGFVVPADQEPEKDLADALDNIANHANVGPFISKQLIERLITSNPSPQYVEDVVAVFNSNYAGERGNLGSTVKAILMHQEARTGHLDNPTTYGKLREPLIRITKLWRAFEPDTIHDEFDYGWVMDELKQAPLGALSVFNFFNPNYALPGAIQDQGLISPEFEILDENAIITLTSRLLSNSLWSHNYKTSSSTKRITINIDREMQLEGKSTETLEAGLETDQTTQVDESQDALLDHLDLLLLGGRMSDELRSEAKKLMEARNYNNAGSQKVAEAIFLIITSPEAAIQI